MQGKGFSLVELSIVLVILGLLVGGILAGQSLIRASELRAVMAEFDRYQTAAHAFRDKYFALPGDMSNATAIWGKDAMLCNAQTGTASTTGSCNGNGDGMVDIGTSADVTAENWQLWRQLALAGLVEGSYSGAGASGSYVALPGTNLPMSKMGRLAWSFQYTDRTAGDTWEFAYNFGNRLGFLQNNGGGVISPIEAWNIDTKMDNGKPGSGRLIAILRNNCANSSSATDYDADYRLSSTSPTACGLAVRNAM